MHPNWHEAYQEQFHRLRQDFLDRTGFDLTIHPFAFMQTIKQLDHLMNSIIVTHHPIYAYHEPVTSGAPHLGGTSHRERTSHRENVTS